MEGGFGLCREGVQKVRSISDRLETVGGPGEEIREQLVSLLLFLRGRLGIDGGQLVELRVGEELQQDGGGSGAFERGQCGERGENVRAPAIGIGGHLVEPLAVIVVPELPKALALRFGECRDEGMAIGRVVEGLPAVPRGLGLREGDNLLCLA